MGKVVDRPLAGATRLGSYEIVSRLARGGMAELFLARAVGPHEFEKVVVLKKILPSYASNPRFVKLFLAEAKLAAALDHPHIAHVYDMGTVDGNYFFTMEFVHGQDVRTMLRRSARTQQVFPIGHAVHVARNVAGALHYAHERRNKEGALLGIVHRDVSPSNILVSYDGVTKLVDFGVAKAATSTVKTRTGTLKGKISYMSPEQAKGSSVDRRSDIFSLGIVLWEMIATKRLFKAENDLATIQQIINMRPPPLREQRAECSEELERIVVKALEADPQTRYQTAEELQLDLEELAREHKLNISTVALRAHMHELFKDEIQAWQQAQAAGQTLTDHVVQASKAGATEPLGSEDIDEEIDEGLDPPEDISDSEADEHSALPTTQRGTIEGHEGLAAHRAAQAPVDETNRVPTIVVSPNAARQPTPLPGRLAEHAPTRRSDPSMVSSDGAGPTMSVSPLPYGAPPQPGRPPLDPRRKQQIAIAGGGVLALIAVIGLATRGSHDAHPAQALAATAPLDAAPAVSTAPALPADAAVEANAVVATAASDTMPVHPKPPTHPAPACDAAELTTRAKQQVAAGALAAGLASYEAAMRCKLDPALYPQLALVACKLGNATKARFYAARIASAAAKKPVVQACLGARPPIDLAPKPRYNPDELVP